MWRNLFDEYIKYEIINKIPEFLVNNLKSMDDNEYSIFRGLVNELTLSTKAACSSIKRVYVGNIITVNSKDQDDALVGDVLLRSVSSLKKSYLVGSFSIVAGDGVQEIKLDNNMFRPTEKVATSTDASSEVSTEVNTEATTEPDTQVATTSDASSEETETTTQIATPTDSIPEVKPVATLASVFRMAKAAKAATTTAVSRGTGYGYDGGTISYSTEWL